MPEFSFSAADAAGNAVSGSVSADDMVSAAEQVRRMGYNPLRVELAAQPARTVEMPAAVGQAPAVTMELPVAAAPGQPVAAPLSLNAQVGVSDDAYSAGGRLEPWERGGPVAPPPPVVPPPAPLAQTQPMAPASAGAAAMPAGDHLTSAHAREFSRQQDASIGRLFMERIIYPIGARTALRDLSAFYRQFATLIHAGLPMFQTLVALEANTTNPRLKEITRAAQRRVQAGGRLSDVLEAYPWIFPPMHIEMIRGAEQGGMLEDVLRQLGTYVDHEMEIRRIISMETFYPKLVLFMALMMLGRSFLTTNVPAISALVLASMGKRSYSTGDYFGDTIGFGLEILLPIVAASIACRLFLFNSSAVREGYDQIKVRIPILGGVIQRFVIAKFCRVFAAMYKAGFGMPQSLRLAGASCGSAVAERAALRAVASVERGGLVSSGLKEGGFFSGLTIDMLRTGEATGSLDETMEKVAEYYEAEAKVKARQLALIFSVFVLLLVAILVGMAVIQFYGGMAGGISAAGGGGGE